PRRELIPRSLRFAHQVDTTDQTRRIELSLLYPRDSEMRTTKTILAAAISLLIATPSFAASESIQDQTGSDNYADAKQQGDGGTISQVQDGTDNVVYTDQNGSGLTSTSDQVGIGNISTAEQTGANG